MPKPYELASIVARTLRIARGAARAGHLPLWRQLAEMAWLLLWRGLGPGYYQMGEFYRREIPWADKRDHMSTTSFRRWLAAINPADYRKLSQHKVAEKALLTLFGLPTPPFLGYLDPVRGACAQGEPLRSAQDLERVLSGMEGRTVCFKLVEGWSGRGFAAVRVVRSGGGLLLEPLQGGSPATVAAYLRDVLQHEPEATWILEGYVAQHPTLGALNPSSVNTLRIWVLELEPGQPKVPFAFVRIGRAGSLVDNLGAGGLLAAVDLDSGILGPGFDVKPDRACHPRHPDHGAAIEGVRLAHWPQARALAIAALQIFPGIRLAGVDIAVSEQGPVVIELNVEPDHRGAAALNVPLRRLQAGQWAR